MPPPSTLLAARRRTPTRPWPCTRSAPSAAIGDPRGDGGGGGALALADDVLLREALRALAVLPADPRSGTARSPRRRRSDPFMRAAALVALARTDRDDFALVLSGLDPDPDWWVRSALAAALGGSATRSAWGSSTRC